MSPSSVQSRATRTESTHAPGVPASTGARHQRAARADAARSAMMSTTPFAQPTSDVRAHAAAVMQGLFGLDRNVLETAVFPGLDMGTGARLVL